MTQPRDDKGRLIKTVTSEDGKTRRCSKCKQYFPLNGDHFYWQKSREDWTYYCHDCQRDVTRESMQKRLSTPEGREKHRRAVKVHREKNKDAINRKRKLSRHGLTERDLEMLLERSNDCCEICKKPFTDSKERHIDHDHNTHLVRGLLCYQCNQGLGQFQDDIASLRRAIDYLQYTTANPVGFGRPGTNGRVRHARINPAKGTIRRKKPVKT